MIKGIILAFLAALSWGAAIVMSKKGLEYLDAGGVFFWQIGSSVILAWFILLIKRKKIQLTRKGILAYSTGIFEPFLAYMLTLYGLHFVSAGIASVIFSLESVFILILSFFILSIKVNSPRYFILFLTGSMFGSLMAALPDINNNKILHITGYLLIIAGVLSAAFYVVISSKLINSFDPVTLLTGQLTFSFILSSLFVVISDSSIHLPPDSIAIILLSGILQYFLAFFFYLHSLRWLPIHIAGAMLYFIPLVALLLSYFFLDEKITIIQGIGSILTVFCIYMINRKYSHD
ncbi:hypothetical protein AO411_2026310 [Salmonella enterica subsp. enterica serovar Sarajane]|nr:hypothetical protein AO411_2026310 [Salmonella enterica subsp. enterica serovar Sarajane]